MPDAVTGGAGRHQSALKYTLGVVGGKTDELTQPLEMQGAGASQHRPASGSISEDDGTRTRNHRIDSPLMQKRKPLSLLHFRLRSHLICTEFARNCLE